MSPNPGESSQRSKPSPAGARASNAGDEFHFLYSARQSLRLLDPDSGLNIIQIEGAEDLDDGQDRFQAIDTTEYYGGSTIADSKLVVANQVKYSPTHPQLEWTTARLTTSKRRGHPSIARKLAKSFLDFVKASSLPVVKQKLKIRLVSNQTASQELVHALEEVGRILTNTPATNYANLRLQVSTKSQIVLEKLYKSVNLGSSEFCTFLQVLDLTACGQGPLALQDALLLSEAGPYLGDTVGSISALVDLVRSLALPGRQNHGLTKELVVAALGAASYHDLFPAQSAFEKVPEPIQTNDIKNLANAVLNHSRVLAHGPAGIGKSTTVQLLESALPAGTVVITYDCWGAGQCFEYGGARHTHAKAIRQIINEFSVRLGLPLLVGQVSSAADFESRLKNRLLAAAEFVKPGLLIIAIDAADNAVVAGSKSAPAFVDNLWSLPIPDNCRLVMTSRTHRQEGLKPTDNVFRVQLSGFDPKASTENLHRKFESATPDDCEQFHQYTDGNPRLQEYKLSQASQKGDISVALSPSMTSLQALFDDLFASTTEHCQNPTLGRELIGGLVCSLKPIQIADFAEAYELSQEVATTFLTGLTPGLVIRDGNASLRDEDFDNYLRQKLDSNEIKAAHKKLADVYLKGGLTQTQAVRAIAEHLYGSQRYDELIDLGLSGKGLDSISDGLLRVQISQRRLTLALEASAQTGNQLAAGKLLLLASRSTKTDSALVELIKQFPELAAAHGDPEAVSEVLLRNNSEPWYGPAHLRAAALCARSESRKAAAKRHLKEARGWLSLYMDMPEKERWQWNLTAQDLSCGGQAHYFLSGMTEGLHYLLRCEPKQEIVSDYFEHLLVRIDSSQLCNELTIIERPQWVDMLFAAAVWRSGNVPDSQILQSATTACLLGKTPSNETFEVSEEHIIDLAEARASAGLQAKATLDLLSKIPNIPTALSPNGPLYGGHETPLRAFCLRAVLLNTDLTIDTLVEAVFPNSDGRPARTLSEKRRDFRDALSPIFPVYALRAESIVGSRSKDIIQQVRAEAEARARGAKRRYGGADFTYREWARRSIETILGVDPEDIRALKEVAEVGRSLYGPAGSEDFTVLAELSSRAGQKDFSSWLLLTLDADIRNRKMPAQEKVNIYAEAALIADRFDQELSRELYSLAVDAVAGVDNESVALVAELSSTLAQAKSRQIISSLNKNYALRLARLLEVHEPFVSEKKYFPTWSVLKSITKLWPIGGMIIAARWADLDLAYESETAPILGQELTAEGLISPAVGLALLRVSGSRGNVAMDGLNILKETVRSAPKTTTEAFEILAGRALRDTSLTSRAMEVDQLLDWARDNGFTNSPAVQSLTEVSTFLHQSKDTRSVKDYDAEHVAKITSVLASNLTTAMAVGIAFTDLVELRGSNGDFDRFAKLVAEQIPFGSRLETLQAILDLESTGYERFQRGLVLATLLETWSNKAIKNEAPSIVEKYFEKCAVDQGGYGLRLLSEAGGPTFNLLKAIVNAVIEGINELDARGFYVFADLLATKLDDVEFADLWDWYMDLIDKDTGESSSAPDETLLNYEGNLHSALAEYLWKIMGYPSRPMTWLAIHSARDVLKSEGAIFVEQLISLLDRREAGPFNDAKAEHLWMSARTMLLVLFLRIAHEDGDLLRPYAQAFAAIALDREFPHAQIRELARRVALSPSLKSELDEPVCLALEHANQPAGCVHPKSQESYFAARDHMGSKKSTIFDFDEMDTIRYWFAPLDRVFGDPKNGTKARADHWISNIWARTNEECRRGRPDRRWGDWQDSSNSHGNVPQVETLRNHLEYHAMMCAAGQMCDERLPVVVPPYEDADDPWVHWLESYLPERDEVWISELRVPTPLNPRFWSIPGQRSDFTEPITSAELETDAQLFGEFVVLDGDIYCSSYSSYESIDVSSAFVTPESSLSFAASFEGVRPHSYRIPRESDEPQKFVHASLRLLPTTSHPHTHEEYLDRQDPLHGGGIRRKITVSQMMIQILNLRYDSRQERYLAPDGELVAYLQHWDDLRQSRSESEPGSSGSRLLFSRKYLLNIIEKLRKDLVIVISVSRNHKKVYEENQSEHLRKTKAFVLRQDGRIDPVRADSVSGAENH